MRIYFILKNFIIIIVIVLINFYKILIITYSFQVFIRDFISKKTSNV